MSVASTTMRPLLIVTIIGYRCKYLMCKYLSIAINRTVVKEKHTNASCINCVITLRVQFESYVFHKSILMRTKATMPLIQSDELIRMMSCMDKLVV